MLPIYPAGLYLEIWLWVYSAVQLDNIPQPTARSKNIGQKATFNQFYT